MLDRTVDVPRRPSVPRTTGSGRSAAKPGIRLSTHLASLTRYADQGEEWNEPEVMLGDMDAFQWVFYYGDRPAMETVGAAILQGWFERFPNMQLLLSEQGTVWLPYLSARWTTPS